MQLLETGCKVRALVLPNDKSVKFIPEQVEVVLGDLTDAASLEPFFTVPEDCTSVVIHCASMVTVNPNYSEKLMAVNVGGTRNIITKVLNHPECEKMVYVSSTGAIPEQPHGIKIKEVNKFDPCDPKLVVGAYSQSKAKATQMVLDEDGVVGGYKKVEQGAVTGFRKVSDFFVRKLFSRKGETVEETRKRLSRK